MKSKIFVNMAKITIFAFLIFFIMFSTGWATTYYVDYLNGADTYNGTATSTPFKHCPGDNNATGIAGSTNLSPEDTIIFKGGITYFGKIELDWSGSDGNPITYDGNSAEVWGSGRAILSGNSLTYNRGFDFVGGHDYITIKNFEIKEYSGSGIKITDEAHDVIIQNCKILDIADWDFSDCTSGGSPDYNSAYINRGAANGLGIIMSSNSGTPAYNIVIDNCEIFKTGYAGVHIGPGSHDIELKNTVFDGYMRIPIDCPTITGKNLENILIHDNTIREWGYYSNLHWSNGCASGCTYIDDKVNHADTRDPHQDGIFVRGTGGGFHKNLRIYNNDFYTEKKWPASGGTAMIFVTHIKEVGNDTSTVYIYNNTFQSVCSAYTVHVKSTSLGDGGTVHIYNNTFYMINRNAIRVEVLGTDQTLDLQIKNNLFAGSNPGGGNTFIYMGGADSMSATTLDYNCYATGSLSSFIIGPGAADKYVTMDAWQAAYPTQSANSIVTNIYLEDAHPILSAASSDLRLKSSSGSIDKGADLSSYFTTDKNGMSRPKGSGWDIGAYEYCPGPTNLRIVPSTP